jgi:hypothetical protein
MGSGGGGGGEREVGRRAKPRDTPTTKSLADLDKELEAFMGEGTKDSQPSENRNASAASTAPAAATASTEDVAMA